MKRIPIRTLCIAIFIYLFLITTSIAGEFRLDSPFTKQKYLDDEWKIENPNSAVAFAAKPKVNLVNEAGLPARPFRTDSFIYE